VGVVSALHEVMRSLADFLFPPSCILCGGGCPEERMICGDCERGLAEHSLLHEPAARIIPSVSDIRVLLPYDSSCRTLVHSFKYHGFPSAAYLAGRLMARKFLPDLGAFSGAPLVPVPLHPAKLRARGYNQSRSIAEGFASFAGNPIREDLIARTVDTGTQTALGSVERAINVRGAFAYMGEISLAGSPVILIDDVLTTGSTISECARTLRNAGAGAVAVFVVATPEPGID
jgi:competence protein ComFC